MNTPNIVGKLSSEELFRAIAASDANHPLRTADNGYREGFAEAFCAVYVALSRSDQATLLRTRFGIGDGAAFSYKTYMEVAVELSVQNHLRRNTGFEINKVLRFASDKDVEVLVKTKGVNVATEVKCVHEEEHPDGTLIMKSAGRVPDPNQMHAFVASVKEGTAKNAVVDKNRDNRVKAHLESAHGKFNPDATVDDLNVLFLAAGDYHDLFQLSQALIGTRGLFTSDPFSTPEMFSLVDVVILSSVRYRHHKVRMRGDWSLDDAFLVPIVNPRRRKSCINEAIIDGLGVFPHHFIEFNRYVPEPDGSPAFLQELLKLPYYVREYLTSSQRARYFPTMTFEVDSPVPPPPISPGH